MTQKLAVGDVVVKLRSGRTRRMRVAHVTEMFATLVTTAPSDAKKTYSVQSMVVPLGKDGMPEGYRREP